MSTVAPGMICIHLDAEHMQLLAQLAQADDDPIQVCAGRLLRQAIRNHTPDTFTVELEIN